MLISYDNLVTNFNFNPSLDQTALNDMQCQYIDGECYYHGSISKNIIGNYYAFNNISVVNYTWSLTSNNNWGAYYFGVFRDGVLLDVTDPYANRAAFRDSNNTDWTRTE